MTQRLSFITDAHAIAVIDDGIKQGARLCRSEESRARRSLVRLFAVALDSYDRLPPKVKRQVDVVGETYGSYLQVLATLRKVRASRDAIAGKKQRPKHKASASTRRGGNRANTTTGAAE